MADDPLFRIAAALERLAPPAPAAADPLAHAGYAWRGDRLVAIVPTAPPLDGLFGLDRQRDLLLANLRRHAQGYAAHDVLLWGARGSGKSALALAATAAVARELPALALVVADDVTALPALFGALAEAERPFVVFLDDLGIDAPAAARALRSLLEGGAEARTANVRLLATANRRHLAPRPATTEASARDALDDELALADRFGLSLGFHPADQDAYLAIVARHAAMRGLAVDPADALGWAHARGGRSGRVAWQYVVELAGRAGQAV